MTKQRAAEKVRAYWHCALYGPAERRAYHVQCTLYWIAIWRRFCPRCAAPLDNVAPGMSVVRDGAVVCASCVEPGEEVARARGLA